MCLTHLQIKENNNCKSSACKYSSHTETNSSRCLYQTTHMQMCSHWGHLVSVSHATTATPTQVREKQASILHIHMALKLSCHSTELKGEQLTETKTAPLCLYQHKCFVSMENEDTCCVLVALPLINTLSLRTLAYMSLTTNLGGYHVHCLHFKR